MIMFVVDYYATTIKIDTNLMAHGALLSTLMVHSQQRMRRVLV